MRVPLRLANALPYARKRKKYHHKHKHQAPSSGSRHREIFWDRNKRYR